jgi:hypothetical protein
VLELSFADRLRYSRNGGLRTANLTLPFKVLGAFGGCENKMARLSVERSNQIFAELEDWEQVLKDSSLARSPKPPAP